MAKSAAPSAEDGRRWLPSRPDLADWGYAGCFAGTALGSAELLSLMALGERPQVAFAFSIIAIPAVLTTVLTLVLIPAFSRQLWSFSRSHLVGLVLGPMLYVASIGGVLEALSSSRAAGLLYTAVAAMAAGAAGLLGGKAGAHLEERGIPLNGPWVWTIAAAFIVLTELALSLPGGRGAIALLLAIGMLVGIALVSIERAKQRTQPPRSWSRALQGALVCAFCLVLAPRAAPYLLSDPYDALPLHDDPNVLLIAWPGDPELLRSRLPESAALVQLAGRGVVYEDLAQIRDDSDAVPDWLTDRDRVPVLASWAARGYATIEIVTRPDSRAGAQTREWSPGSANWFASSGQSTTAGRVLVAVGWAKARAHRGPEELLANAESWLIGQADRPGTGPFAMYLDFRGNERLSGEAFDRQMDRMLEPLELWGGLERCVVVVVVEGRRGLRSALLRPTSADLRSDRGIRVRQPTHPAELAEAMLRATAVALSQAQY